MQLVLVVVMAIAVILVANLARTMLVEPGMWTLRIKMGIKRAAERATSTPIAVVMYDTMNVAVDANRVMSVFRHAAMPQDVYVIVRRVRFPSYDTSFKSSIQNGLQQLDVNGINLADHVFEMTTEDTNDPSAVINTYTALAHVSSMHDPLDAQHIQWVVALGPSVYLQDNWDSHMLDTLERAASADGESALSYGMTAPFQARPSFPTIMFVRQPVDPTPLVLWREQRHSDGADMMLQRVVSRDFMVLPLSVLRKPQILHTLRVATFPTTTTDLWVSWLLHMHDVTIRCPQHLLAVATQAAPRNLAVYDNEQVVSEGHTRAARAALQGVKNQDALQRALGFKLSPPRLAPHALHGVWDTMERECKVGLDHNGTHEVDQVLDKAPWLKQYVRP